MKPRIWFVGGWWLCRVSQDICAIGTSPKRAFENALFKQLVENSQVAVVERYK